MPNPEYSALTHLKVAHCWSGRPIVEVYWRIQQRSGCSLASFFDHEFSQGRLLTAVLLLYPHPSA